MAHVSSVIVRASILAHTQQIIAVDTRSGSPPTGKCEYGSSVQRLRGITSE